MCVCVSVSVCVCLCVSLCVCLIISIVAVKDPVLLFSLINVIDKFITFIDSEFVSMTGYTDAYV